MQRRVNVWVACFFTRSVGCSIAAVIACVVGGCSSCKSSDPTAAASSFLARYGEAEQRAWTGSKNYSTSTDTTDRMVIWWSKASAEIWVEHESKFVRYVRIERTKMAPGRGLSERQLKEVASKGIQSMSEPLAWESKVALATGVFYGYVPSTGVRRVAEVVLWGRSRSGDVRVAIRQALNADTGQLLWYYASHNGPKSGN